MRNLLNLRMNLGSFPRESKQARERGMVDRTVQKNSIIAHEWEATQLALNPLILMTLSWVWPVVDSNFKFCQDA